MRPSFRGKKSRGQRSLLPEAAWRGCAQANVELVWPIAARRQTLPGWQLPRRWVRFIMFPGYWPPFPYIQPRRCATQRGRVIHKHKMAQKMFQEQELNNCRPHRRSPRLAHFLPGESPLPLPALTNWLVLEVVVHVTQSEGRTSHSGAEVQMVLNCSPSVVIQLDSSTLEDIFLNFQA